MKMPRRTVVAAGGMLAATEAYTRFLPITVAPSGVDFRHPSTEGELVAIVREAVARRAQVRVRGSLHSHGPSIFSDGDGQHINVQLDRYDRVLSWDEPRRRVTVQAGIHLGEDPRDPLATWERSLNLQLEQRGWALPILGGITHQTISGFLSTGSAGGSLRYEIGEAVVGLRIVAGDGAIHDLAPNPANPNDENENPFYAAGVSMGLLGIISTVTLQCAPRYAVRGYSVTRRLGNSETPCDPFANNDRGLGPWLAAHDYSRIVLWPQVERCQYWFGNRTEPVEKDKAVPHRTVSTLAQAYVAGLYDVVDRQPPPYSQDLVERLQRTMNLMLEDETTLFHDAWFRAIPIDNAISDVYLPTEFTDLFIDARHTTEVMHRLGTHWADDDGLDRFGPWGIEVYASKASKFWMSPTYQRDAIRLDLMWFKTGQTKPEHVYYPQYWKLVEDLDVRFHWGKQLSAPDSTTGVEARRKAHSPAAWDRFMAVREKMDPLQLFVSSYWRAHLGIAPLKG